MYKHSLKRQNLLYNPEQSKDSCGVGFITHKTSLQTHDLLLKTHQALCTIPHRSAMNVEGVGDGAGVNIDLSLKFFRKITGVKELEKGDFGVANFFFPEDHAHFDSAAYQLVDHYLQEFGLPIILWRNVPVDNGVLNKAAVKAQLPIKQVIFSRPEFLQESSHDEFEKRIQKTLLAIEKEGLFCPELEGFYPLSMSSRTLVYKGRLNSAELIPYFKDLYDTEHEISMLLFHSRFATNTAPATRMAQPFRYMAHNGELNTDKKNRLTEEALAHYKNKKISFYDGLSDSGRLDQSLSSRINEDSLDVATATLVMVPPAWENDTALSPEVRAMLEYFSLYEENNDGPAAIIFSDGIRIGARLDRLGFRPLRSVETSEYLAVMSEAGQIDFPVHHVLSRGRIEAGGMLYFDHSRGKAYDSHQLMERLANEKDYQALLDKCCIHIADIDQVEISELDNQHPFNINQQHTAYSLNQESFKFLLDPMLKTGLEKVSAMGYGITPNALSGEEGGMSRYFSQRFAQVTNPPLDSLRESGGMTLRVTLGPKPSFTAIESMQMVIGSPVLQRTQLEQIRRQNVVNVLTVDALFTPDYDNPQQNANNLDLACQQLCKQVETAARNHVGIIILSDINITKGKAAIPAILSIAAANQQLIRKGLRFNSSLIAETGQAASSHDVATILGFGASAIYPLSIHNRVLSHFSVEDQQAALDNFQKSVEKSLLKVMGKFGLCTVESYIGGEYFESNFLDTEEPKLKSYFPNIHSVVGGARFTDIAASATEWHRKALAVKEEKDIPFLGLFKERQGGAGHSFGNLAVREYINMTDEKVYFILQENSPIVSDTAYLDFAYKKCTLDQIDQFGITPAYRRFTQNLYLERATRPAALRDIMGFPVDVNLADETADFDRLLGSQNLRGNINYLIKGLAVIKTDERSFYISLTERLSRKRLENLSAHFHHRFSDEYFNLVMYDKGIVIKIEKTDESLLAGYLETIRPAQHSIPLNEVQPAHEITSTLTSGAMSHGALVAEAHEAVAQGMNIVGALSNSGEGGEHSSRFNTLRSCKIKQFASGRFGVWAGYLADPNLEEIEIKIAQGAKPGEGGQLPASKVTVEIASQRGGTPKVELISPPPHHDTYSIEDLAQLIHDAKSARVKVIVKLVSSEGIGTISVGVAKAGADVINVAGNSGGTGAASVTSLKNTGRAAEIGIAEVHQALAINGMRDKIVLRCSAAHQNGMDVVKSAILGADSFEFGTSALMMLRCVMAKNCNIRCPAGLTTTHEEFKGDPRLLAQYFMSLAHEVREILASLGYRSLREIRGQTDLLHLIAHETMIGQLDFTKLLVQVNEVNVKNPVYRKADFSVDDKIIEQVKSTVIFGHQQQVIIEGEEYKLNNRNKTVGGQTAIDIERLLSYQINAKQLAHSKTIYVNQHGRRYLAPDTVMIRTHGSAGQSYAAFLNDGMFMEHTGTCNDGVGKTACGGTVVIKSPGGGSQLPGGNVLIGNFALFGASGGKAFINGEAGDRFAVRNSGAMAVVEGVGDFCCEYMTNGAILNLGRFGKGYCTGMSGGNAYQYDTENQLTDLYDRSSVVLCSLSNDSDLTCSHEQFILSMLEQHVEYTSSAKAEHILSNWDQQRQYFKFTIPLWLYQTQTARFLKESIARKTMIEELAISLAQQQIQQVGRAYESGRAIFEGEVPSTDQTDSVLAYKLVNSYAVLNKSRQLAKSLPGKDQYTTRKLILDKARKLQLALTKDTRAAFSNYNDEQLACLLADKRLKDYKQALIRRDVQSIYSIGSTAWIIEQNNINKKAMAEIPCVEKYLGEHNSYEIVQSMLTDKAA